MRPGERQAAEEYYRDVGLGLPIRGSTVALLTTRCERRAMAGTPEGLTLGSGPVSPVAGL